MQQRADRPQLPPAYGTPPTEERLLSWTEVETRLMEARIYWVGTTDPDGAPHAVPLWGVWLEGRLLFGTDPATRTARNVAANPAAAVHLESGDAPVILKGKVERETDPQLLRRSASLGAAKYGTPPPSDDAPLPDEGGQPVYAFHARTAFAWNAFPADATRWRFAED